MISRKTLGRGVGVAFNTLIVFGHTLMFIGAISALWGWYFIGLFYCVMLILMAFDEDGYIRKLRRHPKGLRGLGQGERVAYYYFLALLFIAVIFNFVFILTYLLGIYEPLLE